MTDEVLFSADIRSKFTPGCIRAMIFSGVFGFVTAVLLSSILYVIVYDGSFAICYFIAMMLNGIMLLLRTKLQTASSAPLVKGVARIGGALVILAGVSSPILHYAMDEPFGSWSDVLFLSATGIGSCYALGFILCDVYNTYARGGAPFTAKQLYTVGGASIILGAVCGFLFVLVGVEAHAKRFSYEQWLTALLGLFAGALVGFVNYHAVDQSLEVTFDALPMEDAPDEPSTDVIA